MLKWVKIFRIRLDSIYNMSLKFYVRIFQVAEHLISIVVQKVKVKVGVVYVKKMGQKYSE